MLKGITENLNRQNRSQVLHVWFARAQVSSRSIQFASLPPSHNTPEVVCCIFNLERVIQVTTLCLVARMQRYQHRISMTREKHEVGNVANPRQVSYIIIKIRERLILNIAHGVTSKNNVLFAESKREVHAFNGWKPSHSPLAWIMFAWT